MNEEPHERRSSDNRLAEMEQRLVSRVDERFLELKTLITAAYPGGDPHSHRLAHEEMIASSRRWAKLKFGVVEKVAGGGALAALVFVTHKIWEYAQKAIK